LCVGGQRLDSVAVDDRAQDRTRSTGRCVHRDATDLGCAGGGTGIGRECFFVANAGVWYCSGGGGVGDFAGEEWLILGLVGSCADSALLSGCAPDCALTFLA